MPIVLTEKPSIYYHYVIILTFRPFIGLRITNSSILPRNLCVQAADAIHGHMRSYAQLYSLRRTPSFLPYMVLMSSRLYLAVGGLSLSPESSPKHAGEDLETTLKRVQSGIDDLGEMRACHRVAIIAWNMLRYLVAVLKVYVEINRTLQGGSGRRGDFDPHWAAVSTKQGVEFFLSSESQDDISVWPSINLLKGDTSGSRSRQSDAAAATTAGGWGTSVDAILSLLQPSDVLRSALYWPSPRQPPPLIPGGPEQLQEAGFESLV
jgi:hypothetical protein